MPSAPAGTDTLVERQIEARAKERGLPLEQAAVELLAEKAAISAVHQPSDIAALTVFSAQRQPANMTGTALPVDGALDRSVRQDL